MSSFLILIIALPILSGVLFVAKQQYIKHEMKEALEIEQLTTLTIQPNEIVWHDVGEELIIHQQKFDVKEIIQHTNGAITVKGLFDDEEQKLDEWLQNSFQSKKNNKHFLVKVFFPSYVNNNFLRKIIVNETLIMKGFPLPTVEKIFTSYLSLKKPPPKGRMISFT